jgi:hypothetical protein
MMMLMMKMVMMMMIIIRPSSFADFLSQFISSSFAAAVFSLQSPIYTYSCPKLFLPVCERLMAVLFL